MLYHESITRNLPLFSPPGLCVSLRRLGREQVQFKVEGFGRTFLLRAERPDVFAFAENSNQMERFFADAYRRHISR